MYALTARGMRYVDEYTIGTGISSPVLMENAARGIVNEIVSRFPDKNTKILILCGSGNNGGDAIAVARWLIHSSYKKVQIYFAGNALNISDEFKRQVGILEASFPGIKIAGIGPNRNQEVLNAKYDVIVDGIFGIGFSKVLDEDKARFIDYLNSKLAYKIAIDIPSGLHASSGSVKSTAFKADLTVTFGNYKTGMLFGKGREYCGEVVVVDIGLIKTAYDNITDKLLICDRHFLDSTFDKALLKRDEFGHKGTFGTVGIVVSSNGMLGASMLAAKAAYRAGCGMVNIFCLNKYTGFFNVSVPEAVVYPYKADDVVGGLEEFAKKVDVILVGPGLREDSIGRLLVKQILAGKTKAVFDAGALNLISKNIKAFKKRRCECVITPHLGEMAKLCGEDISIVSKNKISYTRAFSKKFEVSMVLKSDISILSLIGGEHNQKLYVNTVGNSGLATAGSGDVLAGVIASLIAQGNTLNSSLLFGVMLHGRAAENFAANDDAKRRMMARDIIDNLF